MSAQHSDSFTVGGGLVDPSADRLSRGDLEVRLEPKAMAVLLRLARRPREVVSAEALIEEVWHGRPMGDNPVYKCIAQLRKALGDGQQAPAYIETIPRKGYRLIAAVGPANAAVDAGPPKGAATIAVLPFLDMSAEQDQAYFADGMAEELLNALAKTPGLRVIARSSSFAFKGQNPDIATVAGKLDVTHVLEGSVRKSGDRLRITAQLIDARDSVHLWSETYDASVGNVLTLQDEIATEIAAALLPRLDAAAGHAAARPGATATAAFDHYLKGRYFLQKYEEEFVNQARDHFQQALDLEPTFAQAWAGLADTYKTLDYFAVLSPAEAARGTRAAAERALELDPGLAEAHSALATALTDYYFEWESAERHFRDALRLNPSYATAYQAYAEYLRDMGRFDEALAMIETAQRLDPLSPFHQLVEGIILDLGGRPAEAIARYERLLGMHPGYRMAHFYAALAHAHQGQHEATLASIGKVDPEDRLPDAVAVRAATLAALGRTSEAHEDLLKLDGLAAERSVSPFLRALVRLALGEHGRALDLLEQAVAERSWFVRLFGVLPGLDPLRGEPRFRALLERVGLSGRRPAAPGPG